MTRISINLNYLIQKNNLTDKATLTSLFIKNNLTDKDIQEEHLDYGIRDKNYDYKRINYFIINPEKITTIDIDKNNIIIDGLHRIIACYILKYKTLFVNKRFNIDVDKKLKKIFNNKE